MQRCKMHSDGLSPKKFKPELMPSIEICVRGQALQKSLISSIYYRPLFFATWKIQSFRPFSKSWARAWIEPGQFSKYQALKKLTGQGSGPALKMHYSMVMDIFTEHLLCQWDIKLLKMSRLANRIQGILVGPGGLLLKKCTTKVDLLVVVQNKYSDPINM